MALTIKIKNKKMLGGTCHLIGIRVVADVVS